MPDGSNSSVSQTGADDIVAAQREAAHHRRLARRRLLRRVLLPAIPLLVLLAAGYIYATGGRFVGTDNAYVRTHMVSVSADISARVTDVLVHENEHVDAGQPLFELDKEPLKIALAQARANLENVRNNILALKAAYSQRQEDLQAQQTQIDYAEREYKRREKMVQTHVVSESDYDQSRTQYQVAVSAAGSIKQDIQRILAELGGNPDIAPEDHPQYLAAQAQVNQAQLDFDRATVYAPIAGIASMVDQLRPGDYVRAGAPAFSLVASDSLWIEANMKETDLTYVKPGDKATVTVDTYPGVEFPAVVDSVGAATGAEFSILPPQNSSGNWVKVVQRIPVRLTLEPANDMPSLRSGMSVIVDIDTQHHRPLPSLVRTALAWVGAGTDEAPGDGQ
ncbi:MAG TPA: HlyD family secretion protein [Hypericibacter adhaerens]|jgi:membrane fusion protein (multidrug efflux system)|uniref:Hemolysin D n=1 Tax=Hypericibacter adhaerens TaxID=2602016 RepID=A0A5J6N011_9PROT|nr:HlyD family secretion protein [Hypericibacter adhaerens]QEX22584.1 hemolysin D [Hypericibacter adhaerens]HWA41900.1 HlyD family secretion protein [Hypericibacter adhaerens]